MFLKRKSVFTILPFFVFIISNAQVSVCSWNLMNFGKSKSDMELAFIASTINNYDVVTIQEVVAGYGGAKAVSRLVDILNNKGFQWDYAISDPTTSANPSSRIIAAGISNTRTVINGWPRSSKSVLPFLGHEFEMVSFTRVGKSLITTKAN